MKKLLLILMFSPLTSFCQCPKWVGSDVQTSLSLMNVVQKYLQFTMVRTGDTTRLDSYRFADDKGFSAFTFAVDKKNNLDGTQLKTTYGSVNGIYIYGPAERVDKLYTEYFYPLIKSCETKSSPTWIMWNGLMLVHHTEANHLGIPMAYIEIKRGY